MKKPNGKAFCPGCGSRHPEREIYSENPPKEAKVCDACQVEWGAGLKTKTNSMDQGKVIEFDKLLTELPDGLKGNGLVYKLTIQAYGIQWRAGYFSPYDGIWRLHADADLPGQAILLLKGKIISQVTTVIPPIG